MTKSMSDMDKATEQLWNDPDWICPKCEWVNRAIRNRCRNFACDFDWEKSGEGILVACLEVAEVKP